MKKKKKGGCVETHSAVAFSLFNPKSLLLLLYILYYYYYNNTILYNLIVIGFGNEKMLVVVKGVYCVLMISVENCRHILYQKKKKKERMGFLSFRFPLFPLCQICHPSSMIGLLHFF